MTEWRVSKGKREMCGRRIREKCDAKSKFCSFCGSNWMTVRFFVQDRDLIVELTHTTVPPDTAQNVCVDQSFWLQSGALPSELTVILVRIEIRDDLNWRMITYSCSNLGTPWNKLYIKFNLARLTLFAEANWDIENIHHQWSQKVVTQHCHKLYRTIIKRCYNSRASKQDYFYVHSSDIAISTLNFVFRLDFRNRPWEMPIGPCPSGKRHDCIDGRTWCFTGTLAGQVTVVKTWRINVSSTHELDVF